MTRNGVTYVECKRADCPFFHLIVSGDPRQWAEWTHPGQPRAIVSPFVARALAGTMPADAHGARAFVR